MYRLPSNLREGFYALWTSDNYFPNNVYRSDVIIGLDLRIAKDIPNIRNLAYKERLFLYWKPIPFKYIEFFIMQRNAISYLRNKIKIKKNKYYLRIGFLNEKEIIIVDNISLINIEILLKKFNINPYKYFLTGQSLRALFLYFKQGGLGRRIDKSSLHYVTQPYQNLEILGDPKNVKKFLKKFSNIKI